MDEDGVNSTTEFEVRARGRSSIPKGVFEREVSPYRRSGNSVWLRKVECILNGIVVGERHFNEAGGKQIETPLRNGKKHGTEYTWYDDGDQLVSAEPYFEGLPHGTAKQWSMDGTLLGTYTMKHGTGVDLWRDVDEYGTIYLSEVYHLKNGQHHGYTWWLNEAESSVWSESHWCEGRLHGIEREWNSRNRLCRGYPKYYIRGEQTNRRAYLNACKADASLPPFRLEDNLPRRCFPAEIARLLGPNQR